MKWSDLPLNPADKVLRQFAGAWLIFFLALGVHQWLGRGREQVGVVLAVLALVIGALGLVKPRAVRWLFVVWMVLAFPIGWVISQLMLLLLFYGVITPVALIFRCTGRDWLSRKPAPGRTSFWLAKATPANVRSYFRQY